MRLEYYCYVANHNGMLKICRKMNMRNENRQAYILVVMLNRFEKQVLKLWETCFFQGILERIEVQLRMHTSFSHGDVNLFESNFANSEKNRFSLSKNT